MWNEKKKRWITFGAISVAVVIFLKYLLPFCWPVLFAFMVVSWIYDKLLYIETRWYLKRTVSMGILLLMTSVLMLGFLYVIVHGVVYWCMQEMGNMGHIQKTCEELLHQCCSGMEEILQLPERELQRSVETGIQNGLDGVQETLLPRVMNGSLFFGRYFFSLMAKVAVTAITMLLLVREYGNFRKHFYELSIATHIQNIRGRLVQMAKVYLKAEGIILCSITTIVVMGMLIIRNSHPWFMGVVTGILDIFPFIGTGIILIPYAAWMFIQKKLWQGIVLLVTYAACAFVRNLLEPKLIGKGMQVSPVMILLSVFAGIRVYGVIGVVLGPVTFVLLLEVYREMHVERPSA